MDAPSAIIDVTIPSPRNRFKKRRLLADSTAISYGKDRVALSEVDAVAYQIVNQVMAGAFRIASSHTFEVWGRDGSHVDVMVESVPLAKKQSQQASNVFEALIGFSQETLEPRLRDRIIASVRGGTPVKIGAIGLSSEGISISRKLRDSHSVPWDAFAGTDLHKGTVRVFAKTTPGELDLVATVSMTEPNAVLLPELLDALAKG